MKKLEHHELMLAIIAEREGHDMAQAHETEKTMIELENYFEQHYKVFKVDTPTNEIIEIVLDMMGESAFIKMLERNGFSDIFEMLAIEGYVTQVMGVWVVSIEHAWLKHQEIA